MTVFNCQRVLTIKISIFFLYILIMTHSLLFAATQQPEDLLTSDLLFEFNTVVEKFYQTREYTPLWLDTNGPTQQAKYLFETLTNSWQHGLYPNDYLADQINSLWYFQTPAHLAQLDLLLTKGLLRYLTDINIGRINPCLLAPELFSGARNTAIDISALLVKSVESANIKDFLNSQLPSHQEYILLKNTLFRYRKLAEEFTFPVIPQGQSLKPGMYDSRIDSIARRLYISGDLSDTSIIQRKQYNDDLVEAVKKFQIRFNLEPDGIIGQQTIKALNTPIEELIKRILINMERWRWLPRTMANKQVLVNIAGFQLTALEKKQISTQMRVIVGKTYQKTPVFSDSIRYVVINPYWNIPDNIAINDIVPNQIADPEYIKNNNIKIFSSWNDDTQEIQPESINWGSIGKNIKRYRLRQDSGPLNSLGRIKFIFPNKHHVYLHDTPSRNLFSKSQRALSHGCIRISKPEELAIFLLKDNRRAWNLEKVRQQIKSGARKIVPLDDAAGIHLLYRTVSVDPVSEEVFFFSDIYGRDQLLIDSFFTSDNKNICLYPPQ